MDERTLEKPGSTDPGFPASEPLENQGLQRPKRELSWEQVNPVTWKLTDGRGSEVPGSHGQWSGYRTTKAVAWIVGIGSGLWIARYRRSASRPLPIHKAKIYAHEIVKGIRPGIILDDSVTLLNKITAGLMNARDSGSIPPVEPELLDYIRQIETGRLLNE